MRWSVCVLIVLMLAACGRGSPGQADASLIRIDTTAALDMAEIDGVGHIPPGSLIEVERSSAKQPTPPDKAATVKIERVGKVNLSSDTGDAAEMSQTLGSLGSLVWIGAACVIAGVVILAITIKFRGPTHLGVLKNLPIWLGPAISATGVTLIFLPRMVEVAAGPLAIMGVGFVAIVLALALIVGWRNHRKLLGLSNKVRRDTDHG